MMYPELTKFGLENYIKTACGGSIQSDPYFSALERFSSGLSEGNKKVLMDKFKGQSNAQMNDLLNEVAVACVFHPKAQFNAPDRPDLTADGVNIEVKTLNESAQERQRHTSSFFSSISPALNTIDLSNEYDLIEQALKNKVTSHLKKAKNQLNGVGLVYLIWDYDNLLHGEDGHVHVNNIVREGEARTIIESVVGKFVYEHQRLTVKNYYFEKLQELVADPDASARPQEGR